MSNTNLTDKYELYSYTTYLYFYAFFYLHLFEYTFLQSLFINIFGNIIFHYFFGYSILTFMCHKYWKYYLNTISMPQLLTCGSNIIINNYLTIFHNKYDFFIIIPLTFISNFAIQKMYKYEINHSKNLRFIIIFIFLFSHIFF